MSHNQRHFFPELGDYINVWDAVWVEDRPDLSPSDIDLTAICRYMRENNKEFEDLTPEEIEQFRIKD